MQVSPILSIKFTDSLFLTVSQVLGRYDAPRFSTVSANTWFVKADLNGLTFFGIVAGHCLMLSILGPMALPEGQLERQETDEICIFLIRPHTIK